MHSSRGSRPNRLHHGIAHTRYDCERLTDAIRMQLRSQRTHVAGVYAGYIDTDMSAHITQPKISPRQVVDRSLAGVESGVERIFADDSAVYVDQKVRTDRAAFDAELLKSWE